MKDFGVSQTQAVLGLSLYVMGYGIGPMFLTPLQELPSLGRNPVYILGLAVFLLFNVPIVEAKNFSTILAFRFLTGFVASPALATGVCFVNYSRAIIRYIDFILFLIQVASMGDIFPPQQLPYVAGIWALGAVAGPISTTHSHFVLSPFLILSLLIPAGPVIVRMPLRSRVFASALLTNGGFIS
jgi:DHA1 family multidrug resistance protein-like MFS transporter